MTDIPLKNLDHLLRKLSEVVSEARRHRYSDEYVDWVENWLEQNAPQYLPRR